MFTAFSQLCSEFQLKLSYVCASFYIVGVTRKQYDKIITTAEHYLKIEEMKLINPREIDDVLDTNRQDLFQLSLEKGMSFLAYVCPPVNRCLDCDYAFESTGTKPTQAR